MLADLDLLLIAVFCHRRRSPARPDRTPAKVTDAEVVTLCVAQALMGIPSDRASCAVAGKRLTHLFPPLPCSQAFTSAGAVWPTRSSG